MLAFICVYQIASSLISLAAYLLSFFVALKYQDLSGLTASVSILMGGLTGFFIYTNFYLLLNLGKSKKFLEFNKWINFIQVIHLYLFGFIFYLVIGLTVMPSFIYNETMNVKLISGSFTVRFSILFQQGRSDINVGINIIPLILYVMFEYISKNYTVKPQEKNSSPMFNGASS